MIKPKCMMDNHMSGRSGYGRGRKCGKKRLFLWVERWLMRSRNHKAYPAAVCNRHWGYCKLDAKNSQSTLKYTIITKDEYETAKVMLS